MQQQDEAEFYKSTQKNEKAFIGAILLDNTLMDYALEHLDSNSFVIGKHRPIFATMIELYRRHDIISPEYIIKELRVHGDLAEIGGEGYIYSLNENVPRALTMDQDDYIERFAIMAVSMSMIAAAFSEMQLTDIFNLFSGKLGRVRELRADIAKKKLQNPKDNGLIN